MTLLTDPLPLRQNLAWGTYANSDSAVYLPHRYGICGGTCVQYDRQGTQFVFADHPVESIDTVLVNGTAAQGWTWANVTDITLHPVAMITLQQPVDATATVVARGKGKLHPRTGARMTDPAAVLWDVMNIAGRNVAESELQNFSGSCHARGLEVSGSIESADAVLTICNAICSSVGAIFSAGAPGLAVVWPGADTGPSLFTIGTQPDLTVTVGAKLDDIYNDLTVRYSFEAGNPRESLQLEAARSVAEFGRRTKVLDATWCANARTAYDVGSRLLKHYARAQWNVHADGLKRAVKIGQRVTLVSPVAPLGGDHVILGTEYTFSTARTAVDFSAPAGSAPSVAILKQSEAFDSQAVTISGVQTVGSDRVFIITEKDQVTPIPGAAVTLDGTLTRYTDVNGRVTFPVSAMPAGSHALHVVTPDGRTFDIAAQIP